MLCLCLLAAPAWAQKRMALVIGNADYTHESRLNNPVNDARLIAGTLRGLGFSVDERFNLRQRDMVLAINRFVRESAGADTALLYFAGHGMQPVEGGRNYLLAVDADVQHDDALDSDAVPADRIVEQMERSANPARLRLVVLDACRNNRQAQRARSGVRGLARMSPGDDYTLIAFSTNDQSVALDGRGAHSPYAEALNRHLSRARELPVRRIFELTATDVRQATGQQQRPRTYGDLDSRVGLDGVVLAEATAAAGAALVPSPQTAQPALGQVGVSLADLEREQQARQAWAQWQQRMQADFDRIAAFQGGADLRAQAWQRFLDTWRDDNPTGGDDERLRTQARLALTKAQGDAQQQRITAANASVTSGGAAGGAVAGVGRTFKDCDECPEMVVIPAGRFLMGSPASEAGRDDYEGPQRWVYVPSFAMGKFEVTQREWDAVMGSNPSRFRGCGPDCPVESVTWNDAQEFIRRLNRRTGQNYRLPSEAEWEYAARAGSASAFPWGEQASRDHANYGSDACCKGHTEGRDRWVETAPVGQFSANAFGLHDLQGNVWEWMQDVWHGSYVGAPGDASVRETGGDQSQRVLRGGSWLNTSLNLRSASRFRYLQDFRIDGGTGFRLVRIF